MYSEVAPHPNGHVAGEEIFQSGLIPSDTDFRIFRDYGHVPGMDFAHVLNGYRYHTRFDSIDYLPAAVLQRTGDNVLALVRRIADSVQLEDTQAYARGRNVYFDVLGVWFVTYDAVLGEWLNVAVAVVAVVLRDWYLQRATRGTHLRRLRGQVVQGALASCVAAALSAAVCYAVAVELDGSGNALVWYHHTVFAALLYCVPAVLVQCAVHRLFGGWPWGASSGGSGVGGATGGGPLSAALMVQARLNGVNIMYAAVLLLATWFRLRSAYVLMVPLAVSAVTSAVIALGGWGNSSELTRLSFVVSDGN